MNDDQLKSLATYLHTKYCPFNHGLEEPSVPLICDWCYELQNSIDSWKEYEHREWMGKAKELMEKIKEIEQC